MDAAGGFRNWIGLKEGAAPAAGAAAPAAAAAAPGEDQKMAPALAGERGGDLRAPWLPHQGGGAEDPGGAGGGGAEGEGGREGQGAEGAG